MKVGFILHGYPPLHNAGAEWMAHRMLLTLSRQHQVRVVSRTGGEPFQGVDVRPLRSAGEARALASWADVLFTHLNETKLAEAVARQYRTPLVHLVHNDRSLRVYRVAWAQLIVFNSYWLRDRVRDLRRTPRTVLWPQVPVGGRNGGPEGVVGLVNVMEAKGARTFYQVASHLRDRRFEGVAGSYGSQVKPPPFVAVHDNTAGLDWWWPRVGVYCQPSSYESWGMAAVEAMAHGIPVVAAPTRGLLESVGEAGVFHPAHDVPAWVATVDKLGQADVWSTLSVAARDRAEYLAAHSADQMADLELLLARL